MVLPDHRRHYYSSLILVREHNKQTLFATDTNLFPARWKSRSRVRVVRIAGLGAGTGPWRENEVRTNGIVVPKRVNASLPSSGFNVGRVGGPVPRLRQRIGPRPGEFGATSGHGSDAPPGDCRQHSQSKVPIYSGFEVAQLLLQFPKPLCRAAGGLLPSLFCLQPDLPFRPLVAHVVVLGYGGLCRL